jgi:hypothetical protein
MPSDLCTGNPCVVSGTIVVDPGSSLDFGATTDLVFGPTANVTAGDVTFTARSITLQGGSHIGKGGGYGGGVLFVATAGDIVCQGGAVPSRIDMGGVAPSFADFEADSGNVVFDGVINVAGTGPYGYGGVVTAFAVGISGSGVLSASSSGENSGGQINFDATGSIAVSASINVSSSHSGGQIFAEAEGGDASLTGHADIRGGDDSGGLLSMTADVGSITLGGSVIGTGTTGTGSYTCGGDPFVELTAAQAVTLSATMELNGLGKYCPAGALQIDAGTTVKQLAGSKVQAIGLSQSGGGFVDIHAGGDVELRDLDTGSGSIGGEIDVSSGGAVKLLGAIDVSGSSALTSISGCDVYLAAGGRIDAHGSGGQATLTSSETMTIAGNVLASNPVALHLREGAPLITGNVKPSVVTTIVPGLPDCRPGPSCTPGGTCGDGAVNCGEECDEGASNGTPGSQCSAGCVATVPALRIPGGGSRPLDCGMEWVAAIDAADVPLDSRGIPKTSLSCHDNDPSCDFDSAPGRCRFRLWSCLGGADSRLPCSATSVVATSVLSPKANAPRAFELAARQSIQAALTALGVPVGPGEACTPRYEIDLAAGQKPLKIKVRGTLGIGPSDTDTLQLTCLP